MTRGRGLSQLGHVPIIHHVNNLAIHALARQLLDSSSNATTAAVTATAVTGAKEAVATVATTAWLGRKPGMGKTHMGMCQNLVPLVNIKIAGKWMFIPLKMVLIGIDS